MWPASDGLKQEVERSGEKTPKELPLPSGDGFLGGEKIHKSEEEPKSRTGYAQATTTPPGGHNPCSAAPQIIHKPFSNCSYPQLRYLEHRHPAVNRLVVEPIIDTRVQNVKTRFVRR